MEGPLTQQKYKLIREILQYLNKHPNSGDTIENIAMWWIPSERLIPLSREVEDALRYLVDYGLIHEMILPGGKKWFRVNPDKKQEANQLLNSLSDGGWFVGPSI